MSYTKAFNLATDIPDCKLRESLVSAFETLFLISDALDTESINENVILDEIGSLQSEVESSQEAVDEAESARDFAEEKLEEHLQEDIAVERDKLKEQVSSLTSEVESLQSRLNAYERMAPLQESLLSLARQYVSAAEVIGITPKPRRAKKVSGSIPEV